MTALLSLQKVLYPQLLARIPILEDVGEVEAGGAHFGSGVAGEPESNEVEKKSNQVEGESNQVGNEVEGKSNEVSDLDTEHSYSNIKRKPLTNKQKDILNFCSVPRTASEIMDRLGISNQTRNRERHIMPLVTAGYLQLTNPDNPKASNQKYKRTSMGK